MPSRLLITGILCLAVLCPLPVGCGRIVDSDVTTLSFSFWGSYKDLEFYTWVARTFEEQHPGVRIRLQYTPHDYGDKLQLQLISNSAADIILMDDEPYPGFAARGYLEDLQPYIERDGLPVDRFYPTALESFTYRGFIGGMCWSGFPVMLFYNKDLFDEAGLPYPDENFTYDDFRRVARMLTRDTTGDGRLDQFGTMLGFGWLDSQPMFWSFGADFLNEDRTAASLDTPEALAAARFMQDMKFEDRSTIWFGDMEGMNREVQILTGRIGMSMGGWFATQIFDDIEDGMRLGVTQLPMGPSGRRYTRVSWMGISINRRKQDMENPNLSDEARAELEARKEIAWSFVKHMLSEEVQAHAARTGAGIPVLPEYAEKHFVQEGSMFDERIALEALRYGRLTPVTTMYNALRRVIDMHMATMEREAPAHRRTPEEALANLTEEINTILAAELRDFGDDRAPIVARSATPYRIAALIAAAVFAFLLVRMVRRTSVSEDHPAACLGSYKRRVETCYGLLFASPWLLGFCLFLGFPIVFSLVLSFSAWDPYDPVAQRTFIGVDNYTRAFQDPLVWLSLRKTLSYAVVAVPVTLSCALGLALLLHRPFKGVGVFRTLFYLPNVVGGAATAIMWLYIFNANFGPLNGLLVLINDLLARTPLDFIRLPEPQWLQDPNWAMPSLFIMMLWGTGGAAMLIFLAGLQNVPRQLYEAAELDGAGTLRKFWNITLPMLSPTIFFNLIMGMIGAMQIFMQAFLLSDKDGGPQNQLLFYVLYLYRKAFLDYEFGYAAAMAWILFTVIMLFTLVVIRSSALWVYYEGERR